MPATIQIPEEIKERVAALARETGRAQDDLVVEALLRYLEDESGDLVALREGLQEADAGTFVPQEEMDAFWRRVTSLEATASAEQELTIDVLRQAQQP